MTEFSAPMSEIRLDQPATFENYTEGGYLNANPDVAAAVKRGEYSSGFDHFKIFGHTENRKLRLSSDVAQLREQKLERIKPSLRLDLSHEIRGGKYDFLTPEIRSMTAIKDTDAVSANNYDQYILALIQQYRDGIILDCGCGRRSVYYSNVVNYEIVDYDSTDIIGAGELLPFNDATFDAVISIAVLEHVKDPFICAQEIIRVLKPGGKLIACVPFLQPLHGYPNHYYNMTHQGLRSLFDRSMKITDHLVIDSIKPIWSLTWIVKSWSDGLPAEVRDRFLSLPIRELLRQPQELFNEPWVNELSSEKNFELASATMLFATKNIM